MIEDERFSREAAILVGLDGVTVYMTRQEAARADD